MAFRFVLVATLAAVGASPAGCDTGNRRRRLLGGVHVRSRLGASTGSFGGFGGQLNQNLYAKISGPPPGLADVEAKVVGARAAARSDLLQHLGMDERGSPELVREDRAPGRSRGSRHRHDVAGKHFRVRNEQHGPVRRRTRRCSSTTARSPVSGSRFSTSRTRPRERCPNTSGSTDSSTGSSGHEEFVIGSDSWAEISSGRPRATRRSEWFRYMARNMGDLLDAWSVHVYWDFWEPDKIDDRLLHEVRAIYSVIPEEQRRPLYVTEFGVRGIGTFEGEENFEPGLLARRHADVGDERRCVPAGVVQHPRDAARLQRNREMGRVSRRSTTPARRITRRSAPRRTAGRSDPSTACCS